MKSIFYENFIKIITVISINIVFIFFNGYDNFKLDTISKLDYLLFAGFAIIFSLTLSILFQKLLKFQFFTIAITTIINTTIVAVSSVFGLAIYLYFISDNTNLSQVVILFTSLLALLVFAIGGLAYIKKQQT